MAWSQPGRQRESCSAMVALWWAAHPVPAKEKAPGGTRRLGGETTRRALEQLWKGISIGRIGHRCTFKGRSCPRMNISPRSFDGLVELGKIYLGLSAVAQVMRLQQYFDLLAHSSLVALQGFMRLSEKRRLGTPISSQKLRPRNDEVSHRLRRI